MNTYSEKRARDRREPEQPQLTDRPTTGEHATPVLRAGFTDVFVTGMLIKWISVSATPIATAASAFDAAFGVVPKMISKKNIVITTSLTRPANSEYPPQAFEIHALPLTARAVFARE